MTDIDYDRLAKAVVDEQERRARRKQLETYLPFLEGDSPAVRQAYGEKHGKMIAQAIRFWVEHGE
jgi:hypothetical protein